MYTEKNPILLGEAPKGENGYAFDWDAWTTRRISEAIGFSANRIHRYFRPKNLLDQEQETESDGFDKFDHQKAVQSVSYKIADGDRIICVGSRVQKAIADHFGLNHHEVISFIPWCSWGPPIANCQFSFIPHPANQAGRLCNFIGKPSLPNQSITFIITTIRERYPNAFSHHELINSSTL